MTTQIFDRTNVRTLNKEIEQAIQSIAKRYGIRIEVSGARFSPTEITTKLRIQTVSADGIPNSEEAQTWNRIAESILNVSFKAGDKVILPHSPTVYTIVGYNANSPKYPVKLYSQGRNYKVTNHTIRQAVKA